MMSRILSCRHPTTSSGRFGFSVVPKQPRDSFLHPTVMKHNHNHHPHSHRQQQQRQQTRSFFRFSRDQQQQRSKNHHHHQYNHHHHRNKYNSRFFEKEDPGLRWTATVSNPAPVPGPGPRRRRNKDDDDAEEDDTTMRSVIPSRSEQLSSLYEADQQHYEFDVLVIGGGATGAGIALDAASRGLHTVCIDRGDFGSETSSRSTKLIWAGIKYMGTAFANLLNFQKVYSKGLYNSCTDFWEEMKLVYHCHVERRYMTTQNAHLCHWLPIVVPFHSWYLDPPPLKFPLFGIFPLVAPAVFKVYDGLSGFTCPSSYILWRHETLQRVFPQLDPHKIKYCAVFYEAQHNDARTNLAIALTAAQKGAKICNYVAAVDLLRNNGESDDNDKNSKNKDKNDTNHPNHRRVTGAVVVDRMTNQMFNIRAKKVVFAGGPFTDNLRQMELLDNKKEETDSNNSKNDADNKTSNNDFQPAVGGAHGTHIVLPGHLMPQGEGTTNDGTKNQRNEPMGLLDVCTSDGRFLFVIPWLGHTLAGTTDAKGPAETLPTAPVNDIDWILQESGKYYTPQLQQLYFQNRSHVTSSWRGWRPLAKDPNADVNAPVSRDHVISEHPETGVLFIAGGKWTTWREMAQDVVDRLTQTACSTLSIPLLGADGYHPHLAHEVQTKYPTLDSDICQHLVQTYGGDVWEVCDIAFDNHHDSSVDKNRTKNTTNPNNYARRLVEGYPYIEAEVIYACREYACTVEDVLSRRTRLAYLNYQAAMQALPRVTELMQHELQWSNAVTKQQRRSAEQYLQSYNNQQQP